MQVGGHHVGVQQRLVDAGLLQRPLVLRGMGVRSAPSQLVGHALDRDFQAAPRTLRGAERGGRDGGGGVVLQSVWGATEV